MQLAFFLVGASPFFERLVDFFFVFTDFLLDLELACLPMQVVFILDRVGSSLSAAHLLQSRPKRLLRQRYIVAFQLRTCQFQLARLIV